VTQNSASIHSAELIITTTLDMFLYDLSPGTMMYF